MRKLLGWCSGIVVLLALGTAVLSPPDASADSELSVCTASPSIQWMPAASGTRIVWVDQRHGNNDIYMYDMATGQELPICTEQGDQLWPGIHGDRIVWRDDRSGSWEIYLYEISTGAERPIAAAPTSDVWYAEGADIDDGLVVWADDRNDPGGNHDVFAYDLSTDSLIQITDEPAEQGRQGPRVHDGRIVWCDFRNGADGDVYMYDLSTEEETPVADGPISQGQPDIYGDIVVWTQASGSYFGIWYRDVTTPTAAALCDADYIQDHPRTNGRWVVWSDDRHGEGDTTKDEVYAYDMQERVERPLIASDHPYGNLGPAIAETGIVAWQDFRNGDRDAYTNSDIFGYVLPTFADVLATHWAYDPVEECFSAGIVSGYDVGYCPDWPVSRDQMAVFISRADAGGDAVVPDGPDTATFDDVRTDHWAYKYVEYCVANDIVQGFDPVTYGPSVTVSRDAMAVFISRADAGGDAAVPDGPPEATFDDVPTDHWAYKYVEYCAAEEIVQGYDPVTYGPTITVSRDQMAVYVARAFGLL